MDGAYRETVVRRTYKDAYTLKMKELYAAFVHGKPIKTTAADAKEDLMVFQMTLKVGRYNKGATGVDGKA